MSRIVASVIDGYLQKRIIWATKHNEPLWPNGPTGPDYVAGFIRKPGMGSYALVNGKEFASLDDVRDLFLSASWEKISPTDAKSGHQYFEGNIDLSSPYSLHESVILLGELGESQIDHVRIRKGPHGLELVADGSPVQTMDITVIVQDEMLVTWYPGRITPPVNLAFASVKLG